MEGGVGTATIIVKGSNNTGVPEVTGNVERALPVLRQGAEAQRGSRTARRGSCRSVRERGSQMEGHGARGGLSRYLTRPLP